jgi:hypothetical protein
MSIPRRFWRGWRELGVCIGDFQSRLLLTVFYFSVLLPYGLIVHTFGDPLRVRRPGPRTQRSAWTPRQPEEASVERARQMF